MTRLAQRARILAAAFDDVRYFPQVPRPVDVTDAEAFPEIAAASAWYHALPEERRAQMEKDWNNG